MALINTYRGIRPVNEQFGESKYLRFESGIAASILDSSIYNLAGKNFTFVFRICLNTAVTTGSQVPFFTKSGYSIGNVGGGAGGVLGLRTSGPGWSQAGLITFSSALTNSRLPVGSFATIVLRRTGVEGGASDAYRTLANYKLFCNGIQFSASGNFATYAITDPFSNTSNAALMGVVNAYMSHYYFYDHALTDTQISDLSTDIADIPEGAKTIFDFNSNYGKVVLDGSSGANNAELYGTNYTDARFGIPTPSTQVHWSDNVLFWASADVATQIITVNKGIILRRVKRTGAGTQPSFTAVHKRGATTINTFSWSFPTTISGVAGFVDTINETLLTGDTLELTPNSSPPSTGSFIELYFINN